MTINSPHPYIGNPMYFITKKNCSVPLAVQNDETSVLSSEPDNLPSPPVLRARCDTENV